MLPATGRVCPECKCPVAVLDDARPDAPRNSLSTVRRADIDGGGETNKTPPVVPGAMPKRYPLAIHHAQALFRTAGGSSEQR